VSMHIVCPQCEAINRVPAERLGDFPDCGKCHRSLFTGKPVSLTTASFERHVSRNDIPLLVDFWAPWCAPCRMMAPAFDQAAAELEPHFRLFKVNTEEEPSLGTRFGIRSIPTLVLFYKEKEVARQSGAASAAGIIRWARSSVASVA
jgi:thioredoxin 2